jgi:hypothetical protein
MADGVFNIAKGAVAEMFRDAAANGIVLLLTVNQADTTLSDHEDLAVLLAAANTEAVFTAYGRKVTLTGTVTVDHGNERTDVDFPDQTWSPAGNGANETMTKLITAYENAAADATRVPLTHHDFTPTTDGSDLTVQFNAAGFFRAA